MKRTRLTAVEIEAILGAAGNCDVPAMYEDCPTEKEAKKMLAAYERGMDKLRDMLEQRRAAHTSGKLD